MDHFIFKSDDRLHLDKLRDLANFDEPMYGFIVIDGHSALFATIQGNTKTILNELQVNLPNKHNKGGQSSVRFARHYAAARVDWVKKVSEKAKETFLKDNLPLIKGLVLAGSADFKRELSESQFLEKTSRKSSWHSLMSPTEDRLVLLRPREDARKLSRICNSILRENSSLISSITSPRRMTSSSTEKTKPLKCSKKMLLKPSLSMIVPPFSVSNSKIKKLTKNKLSLSSQKTTRKP